MSTAAADASSTTKSSTFFRSRIGSLLAVVPLGVWTVIHLWNNLSAFRGAKAWQSSVTEYSHPVAEFAAGFVVLTPLLIHTFWGLGRMVASRPNFPRYPYYANLKYVLQRLAALGVLAFLGAHMWLAMLEPRLLEGRPEPFADISHEMHHHGPTLLVYVLGTLGVSYHLANGLQTFAMSWGAIYALWSAGADLPYGA